MAVSSVLLGCEFKNESLGLSLCTYLDISSLCKFMGFFLVLLCVRFRLVSNESYRFIGIKNEQSALFL